MIKPALGTQKCVKTEVIVLWLKFMTHRTWKTFIILMALMILSGTTKLLLVAHQLSTFPAHVYEEPFAKNKAINVKKLWTRYIIDHQEQLTWDN